MPDTGWTLRVVWPIENPLLHDHEVIALAIRDLPAVAQRTGAVITGKPRFAVKPTRDLDWPTTPTAVVCEVPAAPAVSRVAEVAA